MNTLVMSKATRQWLVEYVDSLTSMLENDRLEDGDEVFEELHKLRKALTSSVEA